MLLAKEEARAVLRAIFAPVKCIVVWLLLATVLLIVVCPLSQDAWPGAPGPHLAQLEETGSAVHG